MMKKTNVLLLLAFVGLLSACRQAPPVSEPESASVRMLSPVDRYGNLFVAVQTARIFPDGKTFADCTPKAPTKQILEAYNSRKDQEGFDLKAFVLEYFELPDQYSSNFQSDTSKTAAEHIRSLWPVLTREPDEQDPGTLIPLPNPYIVPGGRFGEIYYWDSYFTMLGLIESNRADMVENMLDNFAYLIDTVGFIPNGNRTYFLTRSQPPFFAAMVQLLAEEKGDQAFINYLPQLDQEYRFWMDGMDQLSDDKQAVRHCVRMPDGQMLNRYFDRSDRPRAEMFADDIETAQAAERDPLEVYKDIRSACESGWDFSSRWLDDPQDLSSIRTTKIIPVDLNALLYNLELVLAKSHKLNGDEATGRLYEQRAAQRLEALQTYCWDSESGFFRDYDLEKRDHTPILSLAGVFPLFFEMATQEQAGQVADVLEQQFLQAGGLSSTLIETGQQWDAPNGWAPLQWIAIKGLRNYEQDALAATIAQRWIDLNVKVYKNTGKMVEKYNVYESDLEGGGGEYPVQDGFGWTNGVLLKLLSEE